MSESLIYDASPEEVGGGHGELDLSDFFIKPGEILLGLLLSIDELGSAQVHLRDFERKPLNISLSLVPLTKENIGREVAIMCSQGEKPKLMIVGIIHSPSLGILEQVIATTDASSRDEDVFATPRDVSEKTENQISDSTLLIDGKQIVLEGQEEIVIRCGESSISLHRNGKIAIRGRYLLNRATEVNRILGGSVQVN